MPNPWGGGWSNNMKERKNIIKGLLQLLVNQVSPTTLITLLDEVYKEEKFFTDTAIDEVLAVIRNQENQGENP